MYRTFIFPLRLKNPTKPIALIIPVMGALFNTMNGFINGVSLTMIHQYDTAWLWDPRFILGIGLFMIGFIINQHSDWVLLNLRKPGELAYKIPQGGFYRWISCPNYLGEIIEWCGWAIATWSWAGFAFALWTAANLIPRALSHHRWYQSTFADYPKQRRALIFCLL